MSTRAVYTFKDDDNEFHVYKHHDGYPSGAVEFIEKAIPFAWKLPRFEGSEFGAAFIAANKEYGGGGVYLTTHWKDHGDLDYRYEITANGNDLIVRAYSTHGGSPTIFKGTIQEMKAWVAKGAEEDE